MKNLDFKIKKIAEIFDAKLIGNKEVKITGISDIENAEKGDITFLSNEKYKKYLDSTKASAVIINKEVELPNNSKITFLVVKDSYLSFALLLSEIAPTWVGTDRNKSFELAYEKGADCIIMDDGFQNPTLQKDFSIIVINGEQGFGNKRVIPSGPLRESISRGISRNLR